MVNVSIETASKIARNAPMPREALVLRVIRRLRRVAMQIRADGELSCIDQRMRDDAGLTRESYLNHRR